MSTATFPARQSGRISRLRGVVAGLGTGILAAVRPKAAPVTGHLRDHGYSVCGLGCIAGAAFIHSVFSGFLVIGVLFLVFEWKVSE